MENQPSGEMVMPQKLSEYEPGTVIVTTKHVEGLILDIKPKHIHMQIDHNVGTRGVILRRDKCDKSMYLVMLAGDLEALYEPTVMFEMNKIRKIHRGRWLYDDFFMALTEDE